MKSLVYVLTRRLTERHLHHMRAHRGSCWHIEGPMARGKVTAFSRPVARDLKIPPCEDCRP